MLPGDWGALSVDFGCLGKRAGISSGYAVCSRLAPRRTLDFGILTLMASVCCCTQLRRRCAENASGGDYDAGDEDYYGAAEGSVKTKRDQRVARNQKIWPINPRFFTFGQFFFFFFCLLTSLNVNANHVAPKKTLSPLPTFGICPLQITLVGIREFISTIPFDKKTWKNINANERSHGTKNAEQPNLRSRIGGNSKL